MLSGSDRADLKKQTHLFVKKKKTPFCEHYPLWYVTSLFKIQMPLNFVIMILHPHKPGENTCCSGQITCVNNIDPFVAGNLVCEMQLRTMTHGIHGQNPAHCPDLIPVCLEFHSPDYDACTMPQLPQLHKPKQKHGILAGHRAS